MTRVSVLSFILREMRQRQKSFWGWSHEEWVETVAPSSDLFRKKTGRGPDTRKHLIAICYLLCGFSEFYRIGQVNQPLLASLIFGKDVIDDAITRVGDELRSWGYAETKTSKGYLPNALCEVLLVNRSPRLEDLSLEFLERMRQSDIAGTHKEMIYLISRVLASFGMLDEPLPAFTIAKRHLGDSGGTEGTVYPPEMVRAMATVWLFCGLRNNEFKRLRRGCIRYLPSDLPVAGTNETVSPKKVCWLDVPTNKTGTAFTKPVDPAVGEAVQTWEAVRPEQPAAVDHKTGEVVHYLFYYRGHRIGESYLNNRLIPMLCRKAGVPLEDARGAITSHRARHTITSQLYNAREPMSIWELKEWLGHRYLASTEHYVKTSPTKLAKAYEDAGYFERNRRMIDILIDQEAVRSGLAASGESWKFYDLGHGYCSYDFFDQCPHRMACARCDFYVPKESSRAQLLEGKANLLRMKQEIPLTDEEMAAVDDGIMLMEKLCAKLTDVPTPSGPTPRELRSGLRRGLPILLA